MTALALVCLGVYLLGRALAAHIIRRAECAVTYRRTGVYFYR